MESTPRTIIASAIALLVGLTSLLVFADGASARASKVDRWDFNPDDVRIDRGGNVVAQGKHGRENVYALLGVEIPDELRKDAVRALRDIVYDMRDEAKRKRFDEDINPRFHVITQNKRDDENSRLAVVDVKDNDNIRYGNDVAAELLDENLARYDGTRFNRAKRYESRSLPLNAITYSDIEVIDGDTVETEDGTVHRLIGFDAPEAGTCEGDIATRELKSALGRYDTMTLTSAEKTDKHDRQLSYLDGWESEGSRWETTYGGTTRTTPETT